MGIGAGDLCPTVTAEPETTATAEVQQHRMRAAGTRAIGIHDFFTLIYLNKSVLKLNLVLYIQYKQDFL